MKYNVQLVGVGGQGVLLASMALGSAAVAEGLEVAMSEVHGMAQRGGSVLCSVRMGEGVVSPLIPAGGADLLVGFEPAETYRYLRTANRDSCIITGVTPVVPIGAFIGPEAYPPVEEILAALRSVSGNVRSIDATAKALKAGKAIAANSVLIGAMSAVSGFPLSRESMLSSLLEIVPSKARDINATAFGMGFDEIRRSAGD